MEKSWRATNERDLPQIAKELLQLFPKQRKIAFYGQMGAGKTTFVKALCEALKVSDVVSSPTFSIVNEYLSEQNERLYHFDFYRIKDEQEAFDMGYEDYFYSDAYCMVEWPERVANLIPEDFAQLSITVDEDGSREIKLMMNE
jgi:tRNA threonylcarbamoyladenosine biosynthesis protein TsaE